MKLENITFSLEVKNVESLESLKKKLSRIKSLTNQLEEEISSISNINIELKTKA